MELQKPRNEAEKRLRDNARQQLKRLVSELADLEASKDDLDHEEFEEMKKDTLEQLEEFEQSLANLSSGDSGLTDPIEALRLEARETLAKAMQDSPIVNLFATSQVRDLRKKLAILERGTHNKDAEKAEILQALQNMGEALNESEQAFLNKHSSLVAANNFVQVDDELKDPSKIYALAAQK